MVSLRNQGYDDQFITATGDKSTSVWGHLFSNQN